MISGHNTFNESSEHTKQLGVCLAGQRFGRYVQDQRMWATRRCTDIPVGKERRVIKRPFQMVGLICLVSQTLVRFCYLHRWGVVGSSLATFFTWNDREIYNILWICSRHYHFSICSAHLILVMFRSSLSSAWLSACQPDTPLRSNE